MNFVRVLVVQLADKITVRTFHPVEVEKADAALLELLQYYGIVDNEAEMHSALLNEQTLFKGFAVRISYTLCEVEK